MKVEIQIRTVVQHAWAVIDRRLRYNNEADIPRELRRRLFRISALLELADTEFSEVDSAVNQLREKYEKGLQSGDLKIEINRDSIEIFLARSDVIKKIRAVATESNVLDLEFGEESKAVTSLVQTILDAGFTSIEQVDELLRSHASLELKLASYLHMYAQSRTGSEVSSVHMSDAFLARIAVLLTLPKTKAHEILSKNLFVDDRNTAELKAAIDRE